MSLTGNSHPIETRGSRVSRAPPHHTPPRFSKSSWYVNSELVCLQLAYFLLGWYVNIGWLQLLVPLEVFVPF